jgi:benzodiazapine receptor
MKSAFGLLGWLVICFVAAALGATASIHAAEFYAQLTRPGWAPPASVFGPVWTVLYILMAFSAWRVWRLGGWSAQRVPLTFFLIQLAVNALWSWLFFSWHLGLPALLDIVVLWIMLAITIRFFWRADRLAAVLLIPYLAWISFAAGLNLQVWRLNPQVLG